MSIELEALLHRAQGIMPVNSTPTNNDIKLPDLGIVNKREEQMTRIMMVQLEKLEKITSEINLLRSGFGHVDTKVDKIQAELTMLQARRGNDASLTQTELGVRTRGSGGGTVADEGELSDSDESENESRGERIDDTAAYRSCIHIKIQAD